MHRKCVGELATTAAADALAADAAAANAHHPAGRCGSAPAIAATHPPTSHHRFLIESLGGGGHVRFERLRSHRLRADILARYPRVHGRGARRGH